MISSDVLLGSQDILDDSSWGPQKRFFGFSLGGYLEGGGRGKERYDDAYRLASLFLDSRYRRKIILSKQRIFWSCQYFFSTLSKKPTISAPC